MCLNNIIFIMTLIICLQTMGLSRNIRDLRFVEGNRAKSTKYSLIVVTLLLVKVKQY